MRPHAEFSDDSGSRDRRRRPSGALGNVVTLVSGTLVAQSLPILFAPVLTRLYSPEEFGQFAFWVAVITVSAPLATMRYDQAIITADAKHISDLVRICFATSIAWTLVGAAIALGLGGSHISPLADSPSLYLWLLPVGIFLTALFNTLYSLNARQEKYGLLARATAQRSGAIGLAQIGLGWARNGGSGLVVGQILGQLVALCKMSQTAIQLKRDEKGSAGISKAISALSTARTHRKFPIYSTPAALANEAAIQLTPLLATPLYGLATLGHYALVQRILATPTGIVGSAIGQVYFRNSAERHRRGLSIKRLFLVTTGQLLAIGLPLFTSVWFLAPWVSSQVFGSSWAEAGVYARTLSFVFLARFVTMGVSSTAVVLGQQGSLFAWQVSLLVGVGGALFCAGRFSLSFGSYLVIYSLIAGAHYVVLWFFMYASVSMRPVEG